MGRRYDVRCILTSEEDELLVQFTWRKIMMSSGAMML